jgi:replicative DNA helicase
MTQSYLAGAGLFAAWWGDLNSDTPTPTWSPADPVFDGIEVAPGRIVLVAGPPGGGKTALIGQWVGGLLDRHDDLRVLNANVEMPPGALLTRQLSRLSGVPLATIRRREWTPADRVKLDHAAGVVRGWLDRLAFAADPTRLESVARAASDFGADLVVLDYVQRVAPAGKANGLRERMNALVSELRMIADKGGIGVLAACAVSRSRDDAGRSSYGGSHLSMASLRESGELEFGADDVLILAPSGDGSPDDPDLSMTLAHAKARYGEPRDRAVVFHRRTQRFEVDPWSELAVSPSPPPSPSPPRRGIIAKGGPSTSSPSRKGT